MLQKQAANNFEQGVCGRLQEAKKEDPKAVKDIDAAMQEASLINFEDLEDEGQDESETLDADDGDENDEPQDEGSKHRKAEGKNVVDEELLKAYRYFDKKKKSCRRKEAGQGHNAARAEEAHGKEGRAGLKREEEYITVTWLLGRRSVQAAARRKKQSKKQSPHVEQRQRTRRAKQQHEEEERQSVEKRVQHHNRSHGLERSHYSRMDGDGR